MLAGVMRPVCAPAATLLLRERSRGVPGTLKAPMEEGVMAGESAKVLSVLDGRLAWSARLFDLLRPFRYRGTAD